MEKTDKQAPLAANSDPDVTMGGQAVIEGVMMRGPKSYAVAVRRPQGDIAMISHPFVPIVKRKRWLHLPIVRGAVSLIEMLLLGYRALDYSANVAEQSAREMENSDAKDENPERAISHWTMAGVFVLSMGLAMLLFVALPNIATHFLGKIAFHSHQPLTASVAAAETAAPQAAPTAAPPVEKKASGGLIEEQRPITYNLISGAVRVLVIIAYIWAISLLKDVRRLFQYHGAEHKVVMAYEKKLPLDVEHVRPVTTLHPRCGTTFIAVVLFVSIFVFALLAALILRVYPEFSDLSLWVRKPILIFLHIAFMPLVAGLAYEITRRAGRNPGRL
jgi:uncharacterized protein YqhQ